MSALRQDPVTGRWVIIAPGRAARPYSIPSFKTPPANEDCPFCPGNENLTPPEVWALRAPGTPANAPGWRVRVVTNKYPAVLDNAVEAERSEVPYRSMAALGQHEVIIESPDHAVHLGALTAAQFEDILSAYRARWRVLARDRRWDYLMIYKNQGERAGATLEHVHSQLIALPQVPPQALDELNGSKKHFAVTGRCVYCEMIRREMEHGARLVAQSDRFIALCPFAPRFGFETWILPRNHCAAFETLSDGDLVAFAETLRGFLARLNGLFDNAPFNSVLHSAPRVDRRSESYHWHLEILPQLTRAAGFEWGSALHLNSIAPEEAARLLRSTAA